MRRLPAVARLSGRDGLEQVLPAVLDSLMILSTDAQVSSGHPSFADCCPVPL